MHLITVLTTLLSTSLFTTAHPFLSRRGAPGVYVCEDASWRGACTYITPSLNTDPKGDCLPITYADSNLWLSFGPDKGLKCAVYAAAACQGESMAIHFPGSSHFPGGGAEGGSVSFRCLPEDAVVSVGTDGKGDPYRGAEVVPNQI